MGRGKHSNVLDGSWDTLGGPGRVGGPIGRSGTGRGTLGEVRNGSGMHLELQDESGEPRGGPGRVG